MKTQDNGNRAGFFSPQASINKEGVLGFLARAAEAAFHFFASLQLAIAVLLTLMAVLAAGTIIESLHGTDTAKILVYQSPWFSLVLLLLGINVTAAALDRFPWKRHHTGFVITHVGIVLILIGSFVTGKFAVDGQMAIGENETETHINVPEPLLYFYSVEEDKVWNVSLKRHAFAWEGEHEIRMPSAFPFRLFWTADYPKASSEENILASDAGPGAVHVRLQSSFVNQDFWLIENDASRGTLELGPATLRFTDERFQEKETVAAPAPHLEVIYQNKSYPLPLNLDAKTPASFKIEGTPLKIEVTRILRNAYVQDGRKLLDKGGEPQNPAVELTLKTSSGEEKHTVFSNFPEFPTIHGMKPSAAGVRILYHFQFPAIAGNAELRFLQENGKLVYQVKQGEKIHTGEVALDKETPLGWADMKFRVEKFYPHAKIEKVFKAEPNHSEREDVSPAIRLKIVEPPHPNPLPENGAREKKISPLPQGEGRVRELWLQRGVEERILSDGQAFHLAYGDRRINAGFKLALKDFRMEKYPGTDNPASYESDVVLTDNANGVSRQATISMNKPLVYRGFHIYQSGYQQEEGKPEVSIFTVGKDPGIPIKYFGTIVMVCGIILMFYFKKRMT